MGTKGNKSLIESFSTNASLADAFEFLFENASDAIYILDKHGKFVAVNREAEELTGFKREEWIGKSFRKIIATKSLPKAVEAMPKGGKLTIKSKKTNSKLKIAFTDTGIGIRKEILEKIWTPLFTAKAKGIGLGLPVCKRIVEAHGGNISVESIVGKGTTFTVIIPIKPKLIGGEKIWVNVPESLLSTTTKA